MATLGENINILLAYWRDANTWPKNLTASQVLVSGYVQRLGQARAAMVELADAAMEPTARAVFAQASIFETALLAEAAGATDTILALTGDGDPPRLLMLDRIYAKASGGWWAAPDPSGVTSWVRSAQVSGGAVIGSISADPSASVRAALLKILSTVAYPQAWATMISSQHAFEAVKAGIQTSSFTTAERLVLTNTEHTAEGRVYALAALAQALPTFPTGDGAATATAPPAGKPWYRDGRLIGGGVVGVLTGSWAGLRAAARR